ncbi:MAG: hypothetical protein JRJ03_00930 [Deltaproteobacteria bacterium]|nr:hypothetical protein [Deltaproteobacteria bacterium]
MACLKKNEASGKSIGGTILVFPPVFLLLLILSLLPLLHFGSGYSFAGKGPEPNQVAERKKVYNINRRTIGFFDSQGNIFNISGRKIGSSDDTGNVYNFNNKVVGKIDPGGKIHNQLGTVLGSIDQDGNVYNRNGRKVGSVEIAVNFNSMGGAARLLLLQGR